MAEDFIKKSEYAGLFYPSDPQEFGEQIELTLAKVATLGPDFTDVPLRALIVPSAGFSYSGKTALTAYQKLLSRQYKRVVVLGPSHFFSFHGVALPNAISFETLFGQIEVDLVAINKLKDNFNFHFYENAFAKEYSIEIQLPFLQYCLKDFKLVPLIVGAKVNSQEVAQMISSLADDDTLFVVSTNLSHFHEQEEARLADQVTINAIQAKDSTLIMKEGDATSLPSLTILNDLAVMQHWLPIYIDYGNSITGGDDPDSVVGYGSLIYLQE
jgi:AmmeMemoRadiSam system protein B